MNRVRSSSEGVTTTSSRVGQLSAPGGGGSTRRQAAPRTSPEAVARTAPCGGDGNLQPVSTTSAHSPSAFWRAAVT